MTTAEKLCGRYYRLVNHVNLNEAVSLSETCLIKIKEVEDMTDRAAYLILFDWISGPIDNILPNAQFSIMGGRALLSYKHASYLANKDELLFEKALRLGEVIVKVL